MTPRARRLLRLAFIAAFFLIAPAIILTTAGYRYNFAKKRIERTGVLLADSRPEGAAVFLNGRQMKERTPARLQRLTPGRYEVRLEKEGFRSWSKTVDIESAASTFLNDVILFREAAPELVLSAAAATTGFSPDGRYAAALARGPEGDELNVIDLRTGAIRLIYRSAKSADERYELSWSPDNRRLLISRLGKKPEFLAWNAMLPDALADLQKIVGHALSQAFWSQDGRRLYAAGGGELYEIDLDGETAAAWGPSASQGLVEGGYFYGIIGGVPHLVRRGLGEGAFETLAEMPGGAFRPLRGPAGTIGYAAADAGRLIVIDVASNQAPPPVFEGRGVGGVWSSDGKSLLYWNDLELRVREGVSGPDELVARISAPIAEAAWHPTNKAMFYVAGGDVFGADAVGGDSRVTTPLAHFDAVSDFTVNRTGDDAFFFGTIGAQTGLWSLKLK